MMRIWGRVGSPNVQKVTYCAHELGLAYDLIAAGHLASRCQRVLVPGNELQRSDPHHRRRWLRPLASTARHRKLPACDQCAIGIAFLKPLGFMHFRYYEIVSADGFQNVKAVLPKEDAGTKYARFGACFINTDAPTSLAMDCCNGETRKSSTEFFN